MTYWAQWHGASGGEGPRQGPFDTRREAETFVHDTLRRWADDMESVFGERGVWTWEGELYRDDMFHDDTPIGAFVIESEPEDAPEKAER